MGRQGDHPIEALLNTRLPVDMGIYPGTDRHGDGVKRIAG